MQHLTDAFEPSRSGGVLKPLLEWAEYQVAEKFHLSSAMALLQQAFGDLADPGVRVGEGLGSVLGQWLHGRIRQHLWYFCLCAGVTVAWLVICCALCCVTVFKERRRRRRKGIGDFPDGAGTQLDEPSRYVMFAKFVTSRLRRDKAPASAEAFGDAPDGIGKFRDLQNSSARPTRVTDASAKALSSSDLALRLLTGAALLTAIGCAAFLGVTLVNSATLATVTADGGGVRAMVTEAVQHVNTFLNRSLVESHVTIIRIFNEAQPGIEKLFLDFGGELLDSLMADFKVTHLIAELQELLQLMNTTLIEMKRVANARDTSITQLIKFSDRMVHVNVTPKLSEVCEAAPSSRCQFALRLAPRLRCEINATRLQINTSVAILTLQEMLNLNIDSIQRDIVAALQELRAGLSAVTEAVDSLLQQLATEVSGQFSQAEQLVAEAKSRYEAAVAEPQLWAAVAAAHAVVVSLLVVAGLSLLAACCIGSCLGCLLLRHLRRGDQLDRILDSSNDSNNNNNNTNNNKMVSSSGSSSGSSSSSSQAARLASKEARSFAMCCAFDCSLLLLGCALACVLPLLLGFSVFYASAELQVDACRYLSNEHGLVQWDKMLDDFIGSRVWPKVEAALRSQEEALPLSIEQRPQRLLHAAGSLCADPNRTLFQIFKLENALNTTALLSANSTMKQFEFGAELIRKEVNKIDASSLIPSQLQAAKDAMSRFAGELDKKDYSESIRELGKPLLQLSEPELRQFLSEAKQIASETNTDAAVILKFQLNKVEIFIQEAKPLKQQLKDLQSSFKLLQDSRRVGNLTERVFTALKALQTTISDKDWMLQQVDTRYYSHLQAHLPKFQKFIDPLAVSIFLQVGYCDDLARAFRVVSKNFCTDAVPRMSSASLMLSLLVLISGIYFLCCWLLLLRVRRHQLAACHFELLLRMPPQKAMRMESQC